MIELLNVVVTPLHWYYRSAHLEHVVAEMIRLGPPRLRAHESGGVWYAREGTHRLRAAKLLGLAPVLVRVPWWRDRAALARAEFAAVKNGHVFERVMVAQ